MKKITQTILSLVFVFASAGVVLVSIAQTADADLQSSLNKLQQERQAFKDAKAQENNEKKQAVAEKTQAKREQAEARRAEAEKKMEEKRKTVLLSLIDVQIKHFNKTNDRVQKMPNVSDELKAQLKTEIENAINVIDAKNTEAQNATGKDAIKKLAKDIKDLFKSRRDIVKKIVDAIHASRADKAAETAEERSSAVKSKIKELKNAGQDTSELEADAADANGDISKAKEKIKEKALSEANENLKNAYKKFQDIAAKAKRLE